jgi:phosphatidate cytidylyltransferase
MTTTSRWDDLRPRIITGVALIGFGILVISLGGWVFGVTVAVVTGIMVWELMVMVGEKRPALAVGVAALAAACLIAARLVPPDYVIFVLPLPAVLGALLLHQNRQIFALYAVGIAIAGFGLVVFRDTYGVVWLFWLVITVAMTDMAGYFGGRLIGGAKFWPAISPKKTWSGIVAGWGAAVLVSLVFWSITDAGRDILWIAALMSFASQMGDIAESAVKRRMGVKDSSNLLPGHGGLLDRFDALLGASLFMLLTALVVDVPDLQF